MKRVTEHCIKETGATADQANRIVSDHLVKIEPKDFTENMKCFLLCFYKQIKILTADGKPVVEAVIDFMERRYKKTEAVVKTAVTKCAKETDAKPCEAVYKFEMCMAEQLGE